MSLQDFVPTPRFEEYRETFKDFYRMERRDDGVLLVAAHTLGGPVQLSVQNHRSVGQMLKTVGADPANEVLILTGSGPEFMMGSDPEGFALEEADMEYWAYEYAYKDGRINVSALVNDWTAGSASRCSVTSPRSAPSTASSTSPRPSTTFARAARTTSTRIDQADAAGSVLARGPVIALVGLLPDASFGGGSHRPGDRRAGRHSRPDHRAVPGAPAEDRPRRRQPGRDRDRDDPAAARPGPPARFPWSPGPR